MSPSALQIEPFGTLADHSPISLYRLRNAAGHQVDLCPVGASIVRWLVPDRDGHFADVVLGYDDGAAYQENPSYLGAVAGRFANRIANGKCPLDGAILSLDTNNAPNGLPCHLHGGFHGFNQRVWQATPGENSSEPQVRFSLTSPDGDQGYPGTLNASLTYTLQSDGTLRLDYSATTDRPTLVNLTNHSYFNLAGAGSGDVLQHTLQLAAKRFTPIDAGAIPTGELRSVAGTPFDFTQPQLIGARIAETDEQLAFGIGYDHNFVLADQPQALTWAATAIEPQSGRRLDVATTEPGIQLYTGNFLDGIVGKEGKTYAYRSGFCLETQHFPDSPNRPAFPSTVLRPGETFQSTTTFRFSVES